MCWLFFIVLRHVRTSYVLTCKICTSCFTNQSRTWCQCWCGVQEVSPSKNEGKLFIGSFKTEQIHKTQQSRESSSSSDRWRQQGWSRWSVRMGKQERQRNLQPVLESNVVSGTCGSLNHHGNVCWTHVLVWRTLCSLHLTVQSTSRWQLVWSAAK